MQGGLAPIPLPIGLITVFYNAMVFPNIGVRRQRSGTAIAIAIAIGIVVLPMVAGGAHRVTVLSVTVGMLPR